MVGDQMPHGSLRRRVNSVTRRAFLRTGLSAFTSMTLADLFRMRATAGHDKQLAPKSLLVVWLHGGASHLETYDPKPGRDHWPIANSLIFSGGGIAEGQVIGATDRRGEQAVERRCGIGEFVATIYRHLGVDAERVAIPDFSGRPIPILQEGRPIEELLPLC